MLDFQQKRKFKSAIYNRVTLGVLAVIVLFSLHSVWVVYTKQRESEEARLTAERQVEELRARGRELSSEIERIQTEAGKEAEIRQKFNVARDKESIVVVVDDEPTTTVSTTTTQSFWSKIAGFFGKK